MDLLGWRREGAMKFGVCVNLLNGGTATGVNFAERIAELGYDYIELPLGEMMPLNRSEFEGIKYKLSEAGIACYACNNFIKKGLKLVGPDVDTKAVQEYCVKAIQRANELRVARIGFGSPWAKGIPEGFPRGEAWNQMVELCRYLGPVAKEYGIIITLEHNNQSETNHLNWLWEVNKLAEEVDHPNIQLLVDYYHIGIEREPIEHVVRYGDKIKHVHFAKILGRGYPHRIEEDDKYLEFIHALNQIGYDGGLSIEAYSTQFEADGAATLQFFKQYFNRER